MAHGRWRGKHNCNELCKAAMGQLRYKTSLVVLYVQAALLRSKSFRMHFVFPDELHRVPGRAISPILLHPATSQGSCRRTGCPAGPVSASGCPHEQSLPVLLALSTEPWRSARAGSGFVQFSALLLPSCGEEPAWETRVVHPGWSWAVGNGSQPHDRWDKAWEERGSWPQHLGCGPESSSVRADFISLASL